MPDADQSTITLWLGRLKEGDRGKVRELWQRYYRRLVGLARKKLVGGPRAAADEEDVALSAFDSFCRGAEQGRFPRLEDRDDLWEVLMLITCRKAGKLLRHEGRAKRDWRRVVPDGPAGEDPPLLARLVGEEPDPALAAEMAEQCPRLLGMLADEQQRQVARLKLEGYTNREIAGRLDVVETTVERKLQAIRRCWQEEWQRLTGEGETA